MQLSGHAATVLHAHVDVKQTASSKIRSNAAAPEALGHSGHASTVSGPETHAIRQCKRPSLRDLMHRNVGHVLAVLMHTTVQSPVRTMAKTHRSTATAYVSPPAWPLALAAAVSPHQHVAFPALHGTHGRGPPRPPLSKCPCLLGASPAYKSPIHCLVSSEPSLQATPRPLC